MDDLNLAVWQDADDGHLPLMHDLELSVLLVVLGEQMLPGTADVDASVNRISAAENDINA